METTTILGQNINFKNKFEYKVCNNSEENCIDIKAFRDEVRRNFKNCKDELIYIYKFTNKKINITHDTNFVYIGSSVPENQDSFERFMHHLNHTNSSKDNANNYTLTFMYENNIPMEVSIYTVDTGIARNVETLLIKSHRETFGFRPIGNSKD